MAAYLNYYVILGVREDATQADIQRAYRTFTQIFHPDELAMLDQLQRLVGVEYFEKCHEAYETLMDPVKRRKYNRWLARQSKPKTAASTKRRDLKVPRKFLIGAFMAIIIGWLLYITLTFSALYSSEPQITRKPTHYEILGVRPFASNDEIKSGYHSLLEKNNPAKVEAENDTQAQAMTIRIHWAYQVLSSRRRCLYDWQEMDGNWMAFRKCYRRHQELERREQEERAEEAEGLDEERETQRCKEENGLGVTIEKQIKEAVVVLKDVEVDSLQGLTTVSDAYYLMCYKVLPLRLFSFFFGQVFGIDPCG
ncbi:hypothetical protein BJ170DRAFT_679727 [Xylariales sp. AK1849]|nr:hypothetical protein BJ170DRAFT_679727 [Xylariales sp. AK1849]